MPYPKKKTRGKVLFPVGLRGDDLVHEREQPVGFVIEFDIDVELDVLVLGLAKRNRVDEIFVDARGSAFTFMSIAMTWLNVGMGWMGSLMVLTCSIPFSPYHLRSLMRPMS
jgi:hypothetical protein